MLHILRSLAVTLAFAASSTIARGAFVDLTPLGDDSYSSESMLLSDLVAAEGVDGVTVGDLVFTQFTHGPTGSQIYVRGLELGDKLGISFSSTLNPGEGQASIESIGYDVQLNSASLSLGTRLSGASVDLSPAELPNESAVIVLTSFLETSDVLSTFSTTKPSEPSSQLQDSLVLSTPAASLTVSIDALAATQEPGSIVTSFDTSFAVARPASLIGDFNADGVVDDSDLGIWQTSFGLDASGDADGDQNTDGNDFLLWQGNVQVTADAVSVPEPMALTVGLTEMAIAAKLRRRRR